MKYTLSTPMQIGDLTNFITVDELELYSISFTLDPQNPVLSAVLVHPASGWKHVVTYTDISAVEFWAQTFEQPCDQVCVALMGKLSADKKLPSGAMDLSTVSSLAPAAPAPVETPVVTSPPVTPV